MGNSRALWTVTPYQNQSPRKPSRGCSFRLQLPETRGRNGLARLRFLRLTSHATPLRRQISVPAVISVQHCLPL